MKRTVTLQFTREEIEAILLKHVESLGYQPASRSACAKRVLFRCTDDNPAFPDLYDGAIQVVEKHAPDAILQKAQENLTFLERAIREESNDRDSLASCASSMANALSTMRTVPADR